MLRGVFPARTAYAGRQKNIAVPADGSSGGAASAPPMGLSAR
jgi:hypothetical protein